MDLGNITMVTKIATQGSHMSALWVTEYTVSYSLSNGSYFRVYRPGNIDKVMTVKDKNCN